jgi:hypothetical protein
MRKAALLLFVMFSSVSCGYSLAGRGSFLPEYIRVIGVPLFANLTTVFEVEQKLTEKVRAEFIGRGKYRVMPDVSGVDAVLNGTISSISFAPASFTQEQQASRYVFTLTANIQFRDLKTDKVLWENPALVFREEYEVTTGTSAVDVSAFFGQESNAVERIATDFAKSVVSSILEAF